MTRRTGFSTYLLHLGLFILTFFTTTLVGAELTQGKFWVGWGMLEPKHLLSTADFWTGITYSISFLTFLTFHEFGHYFTALYHRVKSSLPFYIPLFIPMPMLNIGSLGAVIALKEIPDRTRKYFDIGIAGPLAGFVVSIALLIYGFTHLPPIEDYLLPINPDYVELFGGVPDEATMESYMNETEGVYAYYIGSSLLFDFMKNTLPADPSQVPTQFDLIHYPFLFVGYITLFFTALNLLPMGQLDGGHIIYGMFGRKISGYISRIAAVLLILIGGAGLVNFQDLTWGNLAMIGAYIMFLLYAFSHILGKEKRKEILIAAGTMFLIQGLISWKFPDLQPNMIWLVYTWMVVRFVKLDHPRAAFEHRVNRPRQILGWVAIAIFVLCFTPSPILVKGGSELSDSLMTYLAFAGSVIP